MNALSEGQRGGNILAAHIILENTFLRKCVMCFLRKVSFVNLNKISLNEKIMPPNEDIN